MNTVSAMESSRQSEEECKTLDELKCALQSDAAVSVKSIWFNDSFLNLLKPNLLCASNLRALDLSKTQVSDAGAQLLCHILDKLETLALNNTNVGDEGATYIVDSLKLNRYLQRLDLSCTRITDASCSAFTDLILNHGKTFIALEVHSSHTSSEAEGVLANALALHPREPFSKENWDMPPWNTWAFQHIPHFLNCDIVPKGGYINPLKESYRDFSAHKFEFMGELVSLDCVLRETYTDAFIVLHRGEIIVEKYFNGMTQWTQHLSQSVAKSIAGLLCGILVGQGVLDPAEVLTTYLPELSCTAYSGATLQHVLDMTSGVAYCEMYTSPTSDIAMTEYASGWKIPPQGVTPPGTVWEQILSLTEQECDHGSRWSYRSIETDVLGMVMERATGSTMSQLVSELLWQPMCAECDAYYTVDASGYACADGGFNATLRDYARIGYLLQNGGRVNDTQIVPESWIESTRCGNHEMFACKNISGLPDGAYKNQFWLRDSESRSIMCLGIFGQMIYTDFNNEMVIVKLSSWPSALDASLKIGTFELVDQLGKILGV